MKWSRLQCFLIGLVFPLTASTADIPRFTASACEAFGFDFYRKLAATETYHFANDTNIAISPLSLATVLQAFHLGASGKTQEELARAFSEPTNLEKPREIAKQSELNNEWTQFSSGNSLWVDKRFAVKPSFVSSVKEQLNAAVFSADFTQPQMEAHRINEWVSEHTAKHITDLVAPDSLKNTSIEVINAVYFKAGWTNPFDAAKTKEATFHLASGHTVQVPMMNMVAECLYTEKDGIKVLGLLYGGCEESILFLLPKEPGKDGWAAMEANLTEDWFQKMTGTLTDHSVTITLPRWEIACEPPDCIPVLESMGVKKLFQPNHDFTGISNQGPLLVSKFIHRTWISMNEKGTEAAATTLEALDGGIDEPPPATFIANRPFLFVIRHNATGTPLFIGRVSNPATQ